MVKYRGVENAISKCTNVIIFVHVQGSLEVRTIALIAYVTFSSIKTMMSCLIPCHLFFLFVAMAKDFILGP
jgi:hypothetical protein